MNNMAKKKENSVEYALRCEDASAAAEGFAKQGIGTKTAGQHLAALARKLRSEHGWKEADFRKASNWQAGDGDC